MLLVYSIHDRLFSYTPIRICTHPQTLGTTLCYDLETLCVRNIDILLRTYFTSYGCSTQVKDYIIPFLGLRLCGITISPFLNSDWGHSGGIWMFLVIVMTGLRGSLYYNGCATILSIFSSSWKSQFQAWYIPAEDEQVMQLSYKY